MPNPWGYALQIGEEDSRLLGCDFFVDALHQAYEAIEQGARRVVLVRVEGDSPVSLTPLCVFSPPEKAS